MSLRHLALYTIVAGLSIYAWKDWFKSLCGLILLMAVIQRRDMPTTMLGIQGLNLWNILFVAVFAAWLACRRREGLKWDLPRYASVLLLMYLGVVLAGFARVVFDRSHTGTYALGDLVSEYLINAVKWVLPGLLLFDGCRTRRRAITALICVLAMYTALAVLVARNVPFEAAFGGGSDGTRHSQLKGCERVGYSSDDMSTMLAGAFWGMMAALPLARRNRHKLAVLMAAGVIAFGQALTGGRAGYAAWVTIGVILCTLKWRKCLILAPIALILVPVILPGVAARMLSGFGEIDVSGETVINQFEVTSGRTQIWPHVIEKISESPLVGYGRLAMVRTGLTELLGGLYDDPFPHPHNMYLETLLDNGILGSLPIVVWWGLMIACSTRLFRSRNRLYAAVGGLALSLILTQLIGGIGSQHVYPRESTMCMWAAMLLSLRVYVEESRARREQADIGHEPLLPPETPAVAAHAQE